MIKNWAKNFENSFKNVPKKATKKFKILPKISKKPNISKKLKKISKVCPKISKGAKIFKNILKILKMSLKFSNFHHQITQNFLFLFFQQPTLAALDIVRNSKSLTNLSLIFRVIFMSIATASIILFRLWMQNFTTPEFRVEDNPIAAEADLVTRILSQNFLYSFNFYLFVLPDWLCFDWSFGSIEKIENFEDLRIFGIVAFYGVIFGVAVRGIGQR